MKDCEHWSESISAAISHIKFSFKIYISYKTLVMIYNILKMD